MTERRSFYRKVGYLVAIALLCFPLYWLGHPASLDANGERTVGGKLSQEREKYQLNQATLGKIDPASEAMRLGTLGMRGVAVQLLWNSAQHYQMVEDWAKLSATLEQLIRLQPNFYSVWDFQAHNLSYNISVEFDDYRDRFYWVMKGINFLKDGAAYNATDPRFLARIGWIYGNKIGRADEHVQYRRLFRKQQADKGEQLTDNWLVSYEWYKLAQQLVDSGRRLRVYISGESLDRKDKPGSKAPSPLLFHSEPAMSLINYADNLVEEGTFGDSAKRAWEAASEEWQRFANRDLPTSYGYSVRLNQLDQYHAKLKELEDQIEHLVPGEREQIHQTRLSQLLPEERKALETPAQERTSEQSNLVGIAEFKAKVTWDDVALRANEKVRPEVLRLTSELSELAQKNGTIDTYRDIVNYNYWWARCQAEPTEACLLARQYLYDASHAYDDGRLFESKDLYEKSFNEWRKVMDEYPNLRDNNIMADELVEEIDKYKKVIGKIKGEKFPSPFVLRDMIDLNEGKRIVARDLSNLPEASTPMPAKEVIDAEKARADKSAENRADDAAKKPANVDKKDDSGAEPRKADETVPKSEAKKADEKKADSKGSKK
jgi:hypothetical protein